MRPGPSASRLRELLAGHGWIQQNRARSWKWQLNVWTEHPKFNQQSFWSSRLWQPWHSQPIHFHSGKYKHVQEHWVIPWPDSGPFSLALLLGALTFSLDNSWAWPGGYNVQRRFPVCSLFGSQDSLLAQTPSILCQLASVPRNIPRHG